MSLTKLQKRELKSQAHALKPVVMIGNNGLSPNVLAEINLALDHHELIKVKISVGRLEREEIAQKIIEETGADLVQIMGYNATFYREKPEEE